MLILTPFHVLPFLYQGYQQILTTYLNSTGTANTIFFFFFFFFFFLFSHYSKWLFSIVSIFPSFLYFLIWVTNKYTVAISWRGINILYTYRWFSVALLWHPHICVGATVVSHQIVHMKIIHVCIALFSCIYCQFKNELYQSVKYL